LGHSKQESSGWTKYFIEQQRLASPMKNSLECTSSLSQDPTATSSALAPKNSTRPHFSGSYGRSAAIASDQMSRILILCTGNSCRSQMTEYFLRSLDPSLEVCSAGTAPNPIVHPMAVAVMNEIGIAMTDAKTKNLDMYLHQSFDYVITVCDNARESCPVSTGNVHHRLHIGFDDPAGAVGTHEEIMSEFRRVRDEIREQFTSLYHKSIIRNSH
jgi:arsenate reductase (thioredoxin)